MNIIGSQLPADFIDNILHSKIDLLFAENAPAIHFSFHYSSRKSCYMPFLHGFSEYLIGFSLLNRSHISAKKKGNRLTWFPELDS